tara:strand:- start:243 stop:641 length:399 start_codon:yes stop_codon:yes gene_type:complete
MTNSILGQQLKSNLSPEGTGNSVQPIADELDLSTLHNQSSDKNNPTLPYTGPAPLKFQNPLVDSKLDADAAQTTPTMAAQALSSLHDVTSADNNPPLPYRGPAPLKFQNPLIDSKLDNDALGTEKYVDNLPR